MTARRDKRANQDDRARPRPHTDDGQSFVELLVAIVLIGTVVVATLAGVRITIIATRIDRDHSNAHAWLQSATDVLYGEIRADCGAPGIPDAAAVRTRYQNIVRSVPNPEGWPATRISIGSVTFWNGDDFGTDCFDDFAKTLQLIAVEVTNPDGDVIEDVQIVKGGSVAETG